MWVTTGAVAAAAADVEWEPHPSRCEPLVCVTTGAEPEAGGAEGVVDAPLEEVVTGAGVVE